MELAPGRLGRTTVVTFSPKYLFINNTHFTIWIRQAPDDLYSNDDSDAVRGAAFIILRPGQEHSFHTHLSPSRSHSEGGSSHISHQHHTHAELGIFDRQMGYDVFTPQTSSNDATLADAVETHSQGLAPLEKKSSGKRTAEGQHGNNLLWLDEEGEHDVMVPILALNPWSNDDWTPCMAWHASWQDSGDVRCSGHCHL